MDRGHAWYTAGNGPGTGFYKVERYEPGQRCILIRNGGNWGKAPCFDKGFLAVVEDPALSQSMIEGSDADWTYDLPHENLEGLKAKPEMTVAADASFRTQLGPHNVKKAPLDDPKVRRALSLAFPYDDVVNSGTASLGIRAKGVIPAGLSGLDEADPSREPILMPPRCCWPRPG